MFDFVGMLALVVFTAVFSWLAKRVARVKNPFLRWIGLAPAILFASLGASLIVIALIGFERLNFTGSRPALAAMKVQADSARLARGHRIAAICSECHAPVLGGPLSGNNFFPDGEGPPVGTLYAANLTPSGEIRTWSDGEVIRAIREGVHKSGRALAVMPSFSFHSMSDDDAQSLVAYLRSQPPTGAQSPATKLNVLGALFYGFEAVTPSVQPAITHPVNAPTPGPTAAYGDYLTRIGNCRECHGKNFEGRNPKLPGPPAAPNLTAIIPAYKSADDFIRTIRTGVNPGGKTLARQMPWKYISAFATDDDLRAMYAYLRTLKTIN